MATKKLVRTTTKRAKVSVRAMAWRLIGTKSVTHPKPLPTIARVWSGTTVLPNVY